jgi:hypothetical protein
VWEDQAEEAVDQARLRLPLVVEEPELSIGGADRPHVLIEGDNFYSLLGLTYTHRASVDLIYIDPPYNTGKENDFRYNDRFVGEEDAFRHSKWLSFMAPRLEMAWELLTDDGVLLMSIDDNEYATLRLLCDQLFGPQNFIGVWIWNGGRKNNARFISSGHDYILAFARDKSHLHALNRRWRTRKEGLDEVYRQAASIARTADGDWSQATKKLKAWFKGLADNHPSKHLGAAGSRGYTQLDAQGIYALDNLTHGRRRRDVRSTPSSNRAAGACAIARLGLRQAGDLGREARPRADLLRRRSHAVSALQAVPARE